MATQNQLNTPEPFAIAAGGTGVTSVTIAPTASSWSGWDANKNASANSFISSYRTIATAGATTTLVVGDAEQQYFTGTTTQTVVLPVTSTLVLGQQYQIINNSTGVVTVESSGGNTITAMAASTTLWATVVSTSLTTAAAWSTIYVGAASGGTVSPGLINQLAWYAAAGSTVSGLATANSSVLVTSAGGVPSLSTTLPSGLTITSPLINGIFDQTHNLQVTSFLAAASSVNYINLSAATTTNPPSVNSVGTDTNIELFLQGQGTSGVSIQGFTNGSTAAAGRVGEVISSTVTAASSTSYTSGTTTITSISLTAGDWDIYGNAGLAGTTITQFVAGISATNNTLPAAELRTYITPLATSLACQSPVAGLAVSISSTTSYYLVVFGTGTGSLIMYGNIYARRRR